MSGAGRVQVRSLTEADAGLYASLRREMLLDSPWAFGADPSTDRRSDAAVVAADLRQAAGKPGYAIIGGFEVGAEADGGERPERLLSVAVVMQETNPKRRHVAGVYSVYTTPAARGRGLGKLVMQRVIDTARTWPGVELVELSVSERAEAAQRLYRGLGFVAWGRQPDALRVGGEQYAEEHMQLRL